MYFIRIAIIHLLAYVLAVIALPQSAKPITQLTPQNDTNGTAGALQLKIPPNPFVFRHNPDYLIIFDRDNAGHTVGTPGVSLRNWKHAVTSASSAIIAMEYQGSAETESLIPHNRFTYQERLHRGSPQHVRQPHEIKILFQGVSPTIGLTYGDAYVIMLGLFEYGEKWKTPAQNYGGEVKMCRFTVYRIGHRPHMAAKGFATVFAPPAFVAIS